MLSGPKHRVAMPRSLNEAIHNQDLGQLQLAVGGASSPFSDWYKRSIELLLSFDSPPPALQLQHRRIEQMCKWTNVGFLQQLNIAWNFPSIYQATDADEPNKPFQVNHLHK